VARVFNNLAQPDWPAHKFEFAMERWASGSINRPARSSNERSDNTSVTSLQLTAYIDSEASRTVPIISLRCVMTRPTPGASPAGIAVSSVPSCPFFSKQDQTRG